MDEKLRVPGRLAVIVLALILLVGQISMEYHYFRNGSQSVVSYLCADKTDSNAIICIIP